MSRMVNESVNYTFRYLRVVQGLKGHDTKGRQTSDFG